MAKKLTNNFKFWMPLEISKGKDKDGNEVMKIGGIASTADKDADGEYLDPKGFDLKPFKSTGVINWHHQAKNNPEAIIGEPTKAEINKEGLYIEAELWPESELAKKVYKLAEVLKANSKSRKLGFSIEGKALEKDENNPKIIKRASITGCAVTYMPKNPSTFVDIIKGNTSDIELDEEEFDAENGGEFKYLLDMTGKKGEVIRITQDGEIQIDFSKSMGTTGTNRGNNPVIKEHVDSGKDKVIDLQKQPSLTKAEVYDRIFSDFSDIEVSKAKQVYNIISKITQMSKKTKPTNEEIEKAYAILNISKDNSDIFKGEDDEDEEDDKEVKSKSKKASMKKGDDEEDEKEKGKVKKAKVTKADDEEDDDKEKGDDTDEDDDKEKGKVKKAKTVSKADDDKDEDEKEKGDGDDDEDDKEKGDDTDDDDKEKAEDDDDDTKEKGKVKKGKDSDALYLQKGDHYVKMINKGGELKEEKGVRYKKVKDGIFKAFDQDDIQKAQITESLEKFGQKQEEITKALGTVMGDFKSTLDNITSRLDAYEKASPGRKSIDVKNAKTRDKNFEKGGDGKDKTDGDVVSVNNRKLVLAVLEKAMFAPTKKGGSLDERFEKAMTTFEVSGQLKPEIVKALDNEFGIIIE